MGHSSKNHRTLQVGLDARTYPILIGTGLLEKMGSLLSDIKAGTRFFVVSNPTVAAYHLPALQKGLTALGATAEVLLVPDGERYKNWDELYKILGWLLEMRAERQTPLIALGGGVIGDLTGLAASLYQRGMPLIQIPTSLLAQVDSSVGGKTAVNHPLGKNMIGTFHQPSQVLIDLDTLSTLPRREYLSGLAEVVKYGAIKDRTFFEWLESQVEALLARDPAVLEEAIYQSCRLKAEVVAADERETGERALLNFGHTFGHAIEAALGYGEWLHGEAVAAGMVLAGRLSVACRGFDPTEQRRLEALLGRLELPVQSPSIARDTWLSLMGRDKKVEAGRIRFIVLEQLGQATVSSEIDEDALTHVLETAHLA